MTQVEGEDHATGKCHNSRFRLFPFECGLSESR